MALMVNKLNGGFPMGRKVAFVLSGCGVKDGSEIHEAVSALIALDRAGYRVIFTAPDVQQASTVDHSTQEPERHPRNALKEGARIARGDIRPLSELKAGDYDAVVFPGGFGAALTLCSFAADGPECTVNPEVEKLIDDAVSDGKPIAAMCIAPVIIARTVPGARVTIGTDRKTAGAISAMGAVHVDCSVDDAVVDTERKIVTTPAYMLAEGPAQVYAGAVRMVEELERLF
jgi:enhancing lycopene biosynthesis protein 2